MRCILLFSVVLVAPPAVFSQATPQAAAAQKLETGKILPRIPCAAHPDQTYALYLPSNYSSDRAWPLVLSSDPAARGSVPLELQKEAAEKFGYVLASSNNSRNGPNKARLEATEATLTDVQQRVSIDTRRVYLAGFSGGARFSSQIAQSCRCSAGVLLDGAGFSNGQPLAADAPFPVFSAIGILDFNYSEVIPLQDALAKADYARWLRVFDGAHDWAPAEVMAEAFEWLRIQSIKAKREPRDDAFLEMQFTKMQARALSFEQSGDLLSAWREYQQVASTFDSLRDVGALRAKADALGKDKAVREALKREQSDFAEETKLISQITSSFDLPAESPGQRAEAETDLHDNIASLRMNAEHEKRPERARIYKRALAGVFVGAMEAGNSALDGKNFEHAARLFDIAARVKPDSQWAWRQFAVAAALGGQRKEAVGALLKARSLATNKDEFAKWCGGEPAFAKLRSSTEFGQFLQTN